MNHQTQIEVLPLDSTIAPLEKKNRITMPTGLLEHAATNELGESVAPTTAPRITVLNENLGAGTVVAAQQQQHPQQQHLQQLPATANEQMQQQMMQNLLQHQPFIAQNSHLATVENEFQTPPATPTKGAPTPASFFGTPIANHHIQSTPRSLFGSIATPSAAAAATSATQSHSTYPPQYFTPQQQPPQQQAQQQQQYYAPHQQQHMASTAPVYYHHTTTVGAASSSTPLQAPNQQLSLPMDLATTQAIMQLQTQLLTMSQFNSAPRERESTRDNTILAYQMGERLGALGKNDETVRDSLARLQADADRSRQVHTYIRTPCGR